MLAGAWWMKLNGIWYAADLDGATRVNDGLYSLLCNREVSQSICRGFISSGQPAVTHHVVRWAAPATAIEGNPTVRGHRETDAD